MTFPSFVFFFPSSRNCSDCDLLMGGLEERWPGGYGEGRDDAEVLAGALWRPKGSFRRVFDINSTEPITSQCQSHLEIKLHKDTKMLW